MVTFAKSIFVVGLGVSLFALISCGGSDGEQLPSSTSVDINPGEIVWKIEKTEEGETCYVNENRFVDELITVRVSDGQGRALGDVEMIVSLALSENTSGGGVRRLSVQGNIVPFVELYEDRNGNYTPEEDELVSGGDDPLLITSSDEYTGSKDLIVRVNLSCAYKSRLSVNVAGFYKSMSIDVVEKSE